MSKVKQTREYLLEFLSLPESEQKRIVYRARIKGFNKQLSGKASNVWNVKQSELYDKLYKYFLFGTYSENGSLGNFDSVGGKRPICDYFNAKTMHAYSRFLSLFITFIDGEDLTKSQLDFMEGLKVCAEGEFLSDLKKPDSSLRKGCVNRIEGTANIVSCLTGQHNRDEVAEPISEKWDKVSQELLVYLYNFYSTFDPTKAIEKEIDKVRNDTSYRKNGDSMLYTLTLIHENINKITEKAQSQPQQFLLDEFMASLSQADINRFDLQPDAKPENGASTEA